MDEGSITRVSKASTYNKDYYSNSKNYFNFDEIKKISLQKKNIIIQIFCGH